MKRFAVFTVLISLSLAAFTGCAIERAPECDDADACDRALEAPFGDFDEDDPAFGDVGTCWASPEAAAPCVQACKDFVAEELAKAEDQGNEAVILACGGSVEE